MIIRIWLDSIRSQVVIFATKLGLSYPRVVNPMARMQKPSSPILHPLYPYTSYLFIPYTSYLFTSIPSTT